MDYWGLSVTPHGYFSLSKHTKHLLLMTFSDTAAGIEVGFQIDKVEEGPRRDRQDVEVEIVN